MNPHTKPPSDGGFLFRELDIIRVKGKLQGVTIYELSGLLEDLRTDGSLADVQNRHALFAEARTLYAQRKWAEAQSAFQSILNRWPDEGPSRMYWKRCQEYLFDEPPSELGRRLHHDPQVAPPYTGLFLCSVKGATLP